MADFTGYSGSMGPPETDEEKRKRLGLLPAAPAPAPAAPAPAAAVPPPDAPLPPVDQAFKDYLINPAPAARTPAPAATAPAAPAAGYANPGAGLSPGANIGLGRTGARSVEDYLTGLNQYRANQPMPRPETTGMGGRFVNDYARGDYHYQPGGYDAAVANRDKHAFDEYLGLSKEAFASGKQAADEYIGVGKQGIDSRNADTQSRLAGVAEAGSTREDKKLSFDQSMNTEERKWWDARLLVNNGDVVKTNKELVQRREALGGPGRLPYPGAADVPQAGGPAAAPGAPGGPAAGQPRIGPDGKPIVEESAGSKEGVDVDKPWLNKLGVERHQLKDLQDSLGTGTFGAAVARIRSAPGMDEARFRAMIPALKQFAYAHGQGHQYESLVNPSSATQWMRRAYRTIATPFGGGQYSPEEETGSLIASDQGIRQRGVLAAPNASGGAGLSGALGLPTPPSSGPPSFLKFLGLGPSARQQPEPGGTYR